MKGVFTKNHCRFDKRAAFNVPATQQKKPVLNQGKDEFGIEFTQNLMRLLRTPFIKR